MPHRRDRWEAEGEAASPHPLDYQTPEEPSRSFWHLTRQQAAALVAMPFSIAAIFASVYLTSWPSWVELPLVVAAVVFGERIALFLLRRGQ